MSMTSERLAELRALATVVQLPWPGKTTTDAVRTAIPEMLDEIEDAWSGLSAVIAQRDEQEVEAKKAWREVERLQSDLDELRSDYGARVRERDEWEENAEEYDQILGKQGDLLRGVADALNGPPPELTSWSHHDLPEKAQVLMNEVQQLRRLLAELTDPDPCWFDHNGGCQAHGYLILRPGETCPQYDAQQIRAALAGGEQ